MSNEFEEQLDDFAEESSVEALTEDDTSQVGQTSAEADGDLVLDSDKKRNLAFNVFDAMLLISLVFISLAVMLMLWKLTDFGPIFGAPWNTSEIGN
jgi:hypothetical protein